MKAGPEYSVGAIYRQYVSHGYLPVAITTSDRLFEIKLKLRDYVDYVSAVVFVSPLEQRI